MFKRVKIFFREFLSSVISSVHEVTLFIDDLSVENAFLLKNLHC